MAEKKEQPTQETQPKKGKPVEIDIPRRKDFEANLRKIAGKQPDEKRTAPGCESS